MKTYIITVELESHLLTPMQSDTLFGHICWVHRYRWGEEDLSHTLLRDYDNQPGLLVSEAFPQGMLPRPCLPRLSIRDQMKLASSRSGEGLCAKLDVIKSAGRAPFVPRDWLRRPWDEFQAVELSLKEEHAPEPEQEGELLISQNTIDRLTGTVSTEGGFFQKRAVAVAGSRWDIYLSSDLERYDQKGVREAFSLIGLQGFGQDKSTGAGRFKVLAVEPIDLPKQGEAALSLSSFAPGPGLRGGFYTLTNKIGRLGGDWALGGGWPFKHPLTLMVPGSVFMVDQPAPFYGTGLGPVHPHREQVRQQTWMLPWLLSFTPREKERWRQ